MKMRIQAVPAGLQQELCVVPVDGAAISIQPKFPQFWLVGRGEPNKAPEEGSGVLSAATNPRLRGSSLCPAGETEAREETGPA